MGLYDAVTTPEAQILLMLKDQASLWDAISKLIVKQKSQIWANPATAQAFVAAMGTRCQGIFTVSAVFAGSLNGTAALVGGGRVAIGNVMPAGYSITFNADGSGVLTYVDPGVAADPAATTTSTTTSTT